MSFEKAEITLRDNGLIVRLHLFEDGKRPAGTGIRGIGHSWDVLELNLGGTESGAQLLAATPPTLRWATNQDEDHKDEEPSSRP